MLKPKAFLFDAYGTLFDVDSVASPQGLSQLWRRKQLEYTWLRALMGHYVDFQKVTEDALRSALRQLGLEMDERQIEALLQAYLFLDVFEDVKPALKALKGTPLAILSNGSSAMLDAVVRNNGLESYFTEIISVDRVKTYKPSPLVYALGPKVLNLPAEEILFVSSNSWDAAGAKAFGYQVCWCNRSRAEMENLGCAPDFVVHGLDQITIA
jgi:2-haloacid dehalogenase